MKKLRRLAALMGTLYSEMGSTFSEYQNSVGLSCAPDCGACCLAPTIEASPLEMLPTALALFDEGVAEKFLGDIEAAPTTQCLFYKKTSFDGTKGRCTTYLTRPSLCRVFGAAARKNKSLERELSVCRVIKNEKAQELQGLTAADIARAPLMSEWKSKVANLEGVLSNRDMPINEALKAALQKVLLTSQYSPDDSPDHFEPSDNTQAI